MKIIPAYAVAYRAELLFNDPTSKWCLVRYKSLYKHKQVDKYSIRHCCEEFKEKQGLRHDYIFRNAISTLNHKCGYCDTVAPESLQVLFMFLVSDA